MSLREYQQCEDRENDNLGAGDRREYVACVVHLDIVKLLDYRALATAGIGGQLEEKIDVL